MGPGEGKKKLHFHKYSCFKGQIIPSGLKTVTGAINRKIKDFVAFVSCRQDKSFQLYKSLAKVITCCSEVLQHFSFFAKFITLNPFPMIKVFWDTEAERYKSALIQGDSDENRLQQYNLLIVTITQHDTISMSSATKDCSTGNTDYGDPPIISYAFTGVAEKGNLFQRFLKIINFPTTVIF